MAPDHRKQIDNLKKFSVDFRVSICHSKNIASQSLHVAFQQNFLLHIFQLQPSSNPDPNFDQMMTKPARDPADKPKDLPLEKAATAGREGTEDGVIAATTPGAASASSMTTTNTSKPGSPAALSPSPSALDQKRTGMDVISQGVQTSTASTFSGTKHEDKEEKKEAVQE